MAERVPFRKTFDDAINRALGRAPHIRPAATLKPRRRDRRHEPTPAKSHNRTGSHRIRHRKIGVLDGIDFGTMPLNRTIERGHQIRSLPRVATVDSV